MFCKCSDEWCEDEKPQSNAISVMEICKWSVSFIASIVSYFGDFSQGVKELILYKGSPDELSKIYLYMLNNYKDLNSLKWEI